MSRNRYKLAFLLFLILIAPAAADAPKDKEPPIEYPRTANTRSKKIQYCLKQVDQRLEDLREAFFREYVKEYEKYHFLSLKVKLEMREEMTHRYDHDRADLRRFMLEFEKLMSQPPTDDPRAQKFMKQNPELFQIEFCGNYLLVMERWKQLRDSLPERESDALDADQVRERLSNIREVEARDNPFSMEQWEYCRLRESLNGVLQEMQDLVKQEFRRDAGDGFLVSGIKVEQVAGGVTVTGEVRNEEAEELLEPAQFQMRVYDHWSGKGVASEAFEAQPKSGKSAPFAVPLAGVAVDEVGKIVIECRRARR